MLEDSTGRSNARRRIGWLLVGVAMVWSATIAASAVGAQQHPTGVTGIDVDPALVAVETTACLRWGSRTADGMERRAPACREGASEAFESRYRDCVELSAPTADARERRAAECLLRSSGAAPSGHGR